MSVRLILLLAGLSTVVTPVFAQVPYNPTRILPANDGEIAYVFSPQDSSSQFSLYTVDLSDKLNSSSPKSQLFDTLPFLSETTSKAFIPILNEEAISVLAGNCANSTTDVEFWRLPLTNGTNNGTWSMLSLSTSDTSLDSNYLSAGFAFSPSDSSDDLALYIFGGMCPNVSSPDAADWQLEATYSNTMLTLAEASTSSQYQLSLTGARAPPVAEAGLTVTPLTPTFSNTSQTSVSQQQNFILLGGHTQTAFINMSQLAIFSLPQQSWAFVGVQQPSSSSKLKARDSTTVEPRSGHTAVLTEDGSRIIVLGGWVGDISTPATPQLVILEVGQGYGGDGDWTWTVPSPTSSPFSSESGIYGHGAALLPGGVMMVSGGYSMSSSGSKRKRDLSDDVYFLNTTTLEWSDTYTNPNPAGSSTASTSGDTSYTGLKSAEKAGLGAGLGLGLAAAGGVAIVWILYARKLRMKRAARERELREQALGSRYHSPGPSADDELKMTGARSPIWNAMQERQIEGSGNPFPWAPIVAPGETARLHHDDGSYSRYAERTGVMMEIPSPTRGLRKNLSGKSASGHGPFNQHPPAGVPGPVFRIDEEDESSQAGSTKRAKWPTGEGDRSSVRSDPFKDPPLAREDAAAQRKKEVEGWVDDWQSAAESMSLSRSTSQAYSRTYSNVSQFRPPTVGDGSGRGSPEKSDRTGSNLSESSAITSTSFQRSMAGTISRNVSQRSVSAVPYALFAGAAAAMGRFGNNRQGPVKQQNNGGLARAPTNRSISLNTDSGGHTSVNDRADQYAFARGNPWGSVAPGEDQALLNSGHDRYYKTVPENNKYARAGSLTSSSRRAMNLFGSVKRVFTGTGNVDVHDRVAALETTSGSPSPRKPPDMSEVGRSMSAGDAFWRGKRGAKDWEDESPGHGIHRPMSIQRKPVPGLTLNDNEGSNGDEDWDVENAVQNRVVQVMFTVPKEKLRVVNADALSLISSNRSEADHEEDKEREQIKRMSRVREGDDDYDLDDSTSKGKGKYRAY
ncbi:hypothetical protein LTR10_018146 [Elasticomyces elasticus]|uniref:Galactose oxidase n=1 Tax=Exophiala sideris TaxID=1016849 RepID=A0ABR0IX16_9EURO|nr:hypothetical protein LTR10_018146 [Elasticomyces elasticus]KAK5021743.1 hypothetical protein LTS07_010786 [Exophiala sideris]KAK5025100.1 hypothetical protein LTR13_010536 [Exophiala sideris]KAK5050175.1 hypothetical protein LTR69_010810 [Exophiala sideris]